MPRPQWTAKDMLSQRSVPNQEDIEAGRGGNEITLAVDILGEMRTFGPYTTHEAAYAALMDYCDTLIANGEITEADYQKILDEAAE